MSFLELSTIQALLLAGTTAAAVIVLFFLKLRHRRVVVASSLLWTRILDQREANSLMEKLRRWISLLVALTIALLIALSFGRPQIEAISGGLRPLVIVLDSSPTMGTRTSTGRTRWDAAVEYARTILEGSNRPAGFLVADTAGRVQTAVTDDRREVLDAIDRMQPFAGESRFPDVPLTNSDVYFISDGVRPVTVPTSAITISVFEEADNVGITAFDIRVDPTNPSGYASYLEVINYSSERKEIGVLVSGAGQERLSRTISLDSGEAWENEFDMSQFRGGGIRASIQSADDALRVDDVAFGYLPLRSRARTTLVTRSNGGYLETLLRLSPGVELTVVSPGQFQETAATDVYIFEGFAPAAEPSKPSLVFGAASVDWLPRELGTEVDPDIASWDPDHPVMHFVPLHDLEIDTASRIDAGDRVVIASSDQTPLIVATDGPDKSVFVGFDLDSSDFPFHMGFPIFVQNVLTWFSGEELAHRSRLGLVELPLETSTVTGLDGETLPTESRFGQTVIETTEPGLFTATEGGRRVRVAANLGDRRFSDVNRTAFSNMPAGIPTALPVLANELWFYMLLFALCLVGAEWWTYHRRITL